MFSVLAMDVSCAEFNLQTKLQGTAAKFRPHVTIVPRFVSVAGHDRSGTQAAWKFAIRRLMQFDGLLIEMRGIRWIGSDLAWYECDVDCLGRPALNALHSGALEDLDADDLSLAEPSFVGNGYRPHLTMSWHAPGRCVEDLPHRIYVRPTSLSVYQYRGDPRRSAVERTSIMRIG